MAEQMGARFEAITSELLALAAEATIRGNEAGERFPLGEALVWWDLAQNVRDAALTAARMAGVEWEAIEAAGDAADAVAVGRVAS